MITRKRGRVLATTGEHTLKHEQIKKIIRDAIVSGELKPGDCLPSQNVMKVQYGVSHNTVREAVGSLEHEGLVYRIQGKGTFVSDMKPPLRVIGLVIPHLFRSGIRENFADYQVIAPLVAAIEDEARKNHATIVLRLDQDHPDTERQNLLDLLGHRVDGVILFHLRDDKNVDCLEKIQDSGMPLVMIDRYHEKVQTSYVVSDNFKGAYEAVYQLRKMGFDRIFYFTRHPVSSTLRNRFKGSHAAAEDSGVELIPVIVKPDDLATLPLEEVAYQAAKAQFYDVQRPFAVFAANSSLLTGAYWALKEAGISGKDIALACFDEIPAEIIPDYTLVKVSQPLDEIGRTSVRILMEKMLGDISLKQVVLSPEVKVVENH